MFSKIFRGRDDAYGQFNITGKQGDKVRGKAWTDHGKLTDVHYQKHLDGKQGLGVVPIQKDGFCYWGAIDIDDYAIDLLLLEKNIGDLPLVLCRTKSGGAHLYLFCDGDPFPAELLIKKLFEMASFLGHPKSEIFPKQKKFDRETDIGNWINLPYFKAKETDRYAIKNGNPLSLEEFYEFVEHKKISKDNLAKVKCSLNEDFSDAPPCLQHLATIGLVAGQKDMGLYNFTVFFKKKFPDDWENKIEVFNQNFIKPPAKSSTIIKVIKPHLKKDYFYKCNSDPILSFCNKDQCKDRKYGLDTDGTPAVLLGNLTKINVSPIIWYLNVDGYRMEMGSNDILDQRRFRKKCLETVHKIPPYLKPAKWDKLIQGLLDNVEIVDAPEDAGPEGQFYFYLKTFCTERPQADTREGILQNKSWTDKNDITYFRSPDLMKFLDQQKFREYKPGKIYTLIKDLGGEPATLKIKGSKIRVWGIPKYYNVQLFGFEVPQVESDEF